MKATVNDITGDALVSRGNNKKYDDNYDNIFSPKTGVVIDTVTGKEYNKCSKRCWMDVADGVKTCIKQGCTELEKE